MSGVDKLTQYEISTLPFKLLMKAAVQSDKITDAYFMMHPAARNAQGMIDPRAALAERVFKHFDVMNDGKKLYFMPKVLEESEKKAVFEARRQYEQPEENFRDVQISGAQYEHAVTRIARRKKYKEERAGRAVRKVERVARKVERDAAKKEKKESKAAAQERKAELHAPLLKRIREGEAIEEEVGPGDRPPKHSDLPYKLNKKEREEFAEAIRYNYATRALIDFSARKGYKAASRRMLKAMNAEKWDKFEKDFEKLSARLTKDLNKLKDATKRRELKVKFDDVNNYFETDVEHEPEEEEEDEDEPETLVV